MTQVQTPPVTQEVPAVTQTPPANQEVPVPSVPQQFIVQPQEVPPVPTVQTPPPVQVDQSVQHFQSLAEKNRIAAETARQEAERLGAEAEQYRQQLAHIQQQFQPNIPPDPYTPEGQAYLRQQEIAQMEQRIIQAQRQDLQKMIVMAAEQGFANSHNGVDMNSLKSFMRANGIQDGYYDQGLKLMNLSQVPVQPVTPQFQFVPQAQPAIPQNTQPANIGAIRNGVGAQPTQVQVSLIQAMEAYNANPAIENTWSADFRKEFWRHVNNQPTK